MTSWMLRLDKHSSIASCSKHTRLALFSDLPEDISDKYIKYDISLKIKQQGFKYFSENYIEKVRMFKSTKENQVNIAARCHRSQRKNDAPHSTNLDISPGSLDLAHCSYTVGNVTY